MAFPMRLAFALALIVALPTAAAADDFRITLQSGDDPHFEGTGVTATNVSHEPGQADAWRLTTAKTRLVGTVVSDGYFAVARAHQIRPEADGQYFVEIAGPDVESTGGRAWVTNLSKDGSKVTMRVAFPVDGGSTLFKLTRDVTPPGFTLGPVSNISWQGFYTETHTNEYARGNLLIHPAAGGEPVQNPTPEAALLQRFPIIGLRPETDYVYHVEFEDWSHNLNTSEDRTVRTLAKPVVAAPTITAREPPPDATLSQPVSLIAVNFTGPAPPTPEFVTVFVDKAPFMRPFTVLDGRIEIHLREPLGTGRHSTGFELRTAEGGQAETHWQFTVAGGSPGMPAWAFLLVVGLPVLARRRNA